jgi:dTDP-4-amino-4,6-dideoxygalactose transaminase
MSLPDYPLSGFNSRMTDLQGAIGVVQMKRLPALLQRRARLAERYRRQLRGCPGIAVPSPRPPTGHSWQSFVIRFPQDADRCERVAAALRDEGIATRPGTHAVPWLGAFRERAAEDRPACPNARAVERTSMALPLFAEMGERDVDRVCKALRSHVS